MQKQIHCLSEIGFIRSFFFFAALIFSLCIISTRSEAALETTGPAVIPSEYGKVIYRCNETSPNQLYIIAIGHRSAVTLSNGNNTVKTQEDVYRIGEWLIREKGLGLILPEGYFARNADTVVKKADFIVVTKPLDSETVQKRLADNSVFTNAEMLLIESYRVKLQQVEDRSLYNAVRSRVLKLERDSNPYELVALRSELDYLQEMRTASILQKIPDLINDEFKEGNIDRKDAILTIGLDHIRDIMRYLKEHKIVVNSPAFNSITDKDFVSDMNLLTENFGVTVIIPRTLADDREALKATHLDQFIPKKN